MTKSQRCVPLFNLCVALVLAVLSQVASAAGAGAGDWKFELLGPGGGGTFLTCSASVADPNFMLCACDMSGCYRSWDGGHTWTLIPWQNVISGSSETACQPYFHPTNANIAVWRNSITRDKGVTWQPMCQDKPAPWGPAINIHHIACSGEEQPAVYVGSDQGIWGSQGDLKSWKQLAKGPCGGIQVMADGAVFAAAGNVLYQWTALKTEPVAMETTGLPGAITALAAGMEGTNRVLHVVSAGGLFTSRDSGKMWKKTLDRPNMTQVVMARNQTQVAYAGDRMDVFVTKDSGATWSSTFHYGKNTTHTWVDREMYWGYYIQPRSLGCGQGDPRIATVTTQAELFITTDFGATWESRHGKEFGPMPDAPNSARLQGVGAETTACYDYVFDPNDPKRHYVAFGDIGLIRSIDAGSTWAWALKDKGCPWKNSCYDLSFDPFHKGRMFGAFSSFHEVMHWICCTTPNAAANKGGVCVSDDYGVTWRALSGLPLAPCTSVKVDLKHSTADALVLYATVWGHGVFQSTDSGVTWKEKPGVGRAGNMNALQLQIHPKTGDIYANTAANRNGSTFPVASGLWKSSDGGDTWAEITAGQNIKWMNAFAIDPLDPNNIFITGSDIPSSAQGGVYRTTDGGASWTRVLDGSKSPDGFLHGLFVEFNPYEPKVIYFGSTGGLWASPDGGTTWRLLEKIPFKICHRVRIDPANHDIMYVTTDGCGIIRCPTLRGNPGE